MPVLSPVEGPVLSKIVSETIVGQRPTPSPSTRIRPSGKGATPPHEGALPPDVPSTLSTSARIPPLGADPKFFTPGKLNL